MSAPTGATASISGTPGVLTCSWTPGTVTGSYIVTVTQTSQSVVSTITLPFVTTTSTTYTNIVTTATYSFVVAAYAAANGTGTPFTSSASSTIAYYNPFGGPQGIQGIQGVQGANGGLGPVGAQGPAGLQGIVNISNNPNNVANYLLTTTTVPGTINANSLLTFSGTTLNIGGNITGVTSINNTVVGGVTLSGGNITGLGSINNTVVGGVTLSGGAIYGTLYGSVSGNVTGNATTATLLSAGRAFNTGSWYTADDTSATFRLLFNANGSTGIHGSNSVILFVNNATAGTFSPSGLSVVGVTTTTGINNGGGGIVNAGICYTDKVSVNSQSAPVGTLSVSLPNSTSTGGTTAAWDSSWAIFGPGATSASGGGLGIGFSQTNNVSYITSLTPSVSWRNLGITGSNIILGVVGTGVAIGANGNGTLANPSYMLDVSGTIRATGGMVYSVQTI